MHVGVLGGPRPARIDDHDLAAARPDGAQPLADVGCRHQAPVRDDGVGAEDQKILRPIDVRHRDRERQSEHETSGNVLRHLVDGARREDAPRAEHAEERPGVEGEGERVHGGVPEVDGDRVLAVRRTKRGQTAVDLGESVVPPDLLPGRAAPDHRAAEAIGIGVEVLERRALRTDVPSAERIPVVAADRRDRAPVCLDLEPAGGFTERAGPVAGRGLHRLALLPRTGQCNATAQGGMPIARRTTTNAAVRRPYSSRTTERRLSAARSPPSRSCLRTGRVSGVRCHLPKTPVL